MITKRDGKHSDKIFKLLSILLNSTLKISNVSHEKVHNNVTCDSCNTGKILYNRYKCYKCKNYDLCGLCFENRIFKQNEENKHEKSHLMVLIKEPIQRQLKEEEVSIFFDGVSLKEADKINDYLVSKKIQLQEIKCIECMKKGKKGNIEGIRYKCDNCFKINNS
jgi:hypothetical protein